MKKSFILTLVIVGILSACFSSLVDYLLALGYVNLVIFFLKICMWFLIGSLGAIIHHLLH